MFKPLVKSSSYFYLARHGETDWNRHRRLQGHLNSDLSPTGKQQAESLAQLAEDNAIELIISSPLGRALDTAIICQKKLSLDLSISDELIERHFGDWQGLYFDDLQSETHFESIFFQVTEQSPPNGESGLDCAIRINNCLKSIALQHSQKRILVVTHGDAIRCFLSSLSHQSACDAYSQYGNGKLFPIEFCHTSQEFKML